MAESEDYGSVCGEFTAAPLCGAAISCSFWYRPDPVNNPTGYQALPQEISISDLNPNKLVLDKCADGSNTNGTPDPGDCASPVANSWDIVLLAEIAGVTSNAYHFRVEMTNPCATNTISFAPEIGAATVELLASGVTTQGLGGLT
jgi:hypothetical protein